MSNGIKRIGKGLFAIFMIKLVLISGLFVFQSCQQETDFDTELQQESKTNFLAALQESNQKIREVTIEKYSDDTNRNGNDAFTAKDGLSFKQICLESLLATINTDTVTTTVSDPIDTSGVLTLGDVFDIAEQTNTRPVAVDDTVTDPVVDDTVTSTVPTLDCFSIPTEPTLAALDPAILEAKNFFYSYGFSDTDILEMLDGEDEAFLVPTTIAMINAMNDDSLVNNDEMNYINFLFGGETVVAQSSGDNYIDRTWSCFWEATGIGAFSESFKGVQNGNKALLKRAGSKAIKKLASRFLGPIGLAIALVEFAFCMNR